MPVRSGVSQKCGDKTGSRKREVECEGNLFDKEPSLMETQSLRRRLKARLEELIDHAFTA